MAGIGFELRRILRNQGLFDYLRAYGYAGVIGSGPWVLSMLSVLAVGLGRVALRGDRSMEQFQLAVTYLMAGSLILTGPLQLLFTRYASDRCYEKREGAVLPNLLGALTIVTFAAGLLGGAVAVTLAATTTLLTRVLLVAAFVALCESWLLVVLLAGLKKYRSILVVFAVAALGGAALSRLLHPFGLTGLLAGFTLGQCGLVCALLALVVRAYRPEGALVSFDFLRPTRSFYGLALVGLLYAVGIWIDKALFWTHPDTSAPVLGPLRASVVYDLPIFLAYLSIVPGMAVFLLRVETDFAANYHAYFDAVRGGATLADLRCRKDDMVIATRRGLFDILKVQGLAVVFTVLAGPQLLAAFGIPQTYVPLLSVDVVGIGVQVFLLAVLNVLFYLDKRGRALIVTAVFAGANGILTWYSQQLGPAFYGYGFALGALLASLVGLVLLDEALRRLEFDTFMGQR